MNSTSRMSHQGQIEDRELKALLGKEKTHILYTVKIENNRGEEHGPASMAVIRQVIKASKKSFRSKKATVFINPISTHNAPTPNRLSAR